ncbi:hypothetical protein [Streptacidiphilus fuscans]|uniref:hypothetical protein n=1 Tax=Streptacidiphilus fuscans TaxID=2789292 RepID=UPI0018AC8EB5|nr:hypothetical protein [Streptacidiphilus fuscans]
MSPEAAALAQAQSTGQSVPVDADTTSTSTTVANPDGTFTYTAGVLPVRAQQNGTWVPVDATLTPVSGGYSPKAAVSGVVFSAGGTGPLATLTNSSGQSVSVSWPSALPAPTVSGATATYAGVYPGVDLQMTATVEGGYTEQLVITNATAAANPALADIHFNTSTSAGLTLSTNTSGGLQATDASGNVAFSSPTATMWSTPTSSSGAASGQSASQGSSPSSEDTAATPVGVDVSTTGMDLVPPTRALTSSNNTYPLVIDPSLAPKELGWTWVSSVDSGSSFWEGSNNTHDSNNHVGYDDWCSDGSSGCTGFGVTRSLYNFDMTGLLGKHVTGATLTIYEQGPTSSWSGSNPYDLHGGGAIDPSTTWDNASIWSAVSSSSSLASLNSNSQGSADFSATSLVQNAVASSYHSQTMVIQAQNESDDTAYRELLGGAQLQVTYWATPPAPGNLSITNSGKTMPCTTSGGVDTASPGYWVNASDSKTIKLNATLSSPDSGSYGTTETSQFWLHETSPNPPAHWSNLGGTTVTLQANPQATSMTTPPLDDNAIYQWQAYATNPGGYGSDAAPAATTDCWFQTDFTPPTLGTPSGTPPTSTASGSNTATITFSATDTGSGVANFLFNMNGTSLTSGGDGEKTISTSNGTAQFTVTAEHWGTNTLWYSAVDAAGNQAQPQHFDFYVPDSAYTPGVAGDLNGDGTPDIAAVTKSGDLNFYNDPLSADPDTSGQPLIPASSAPGGAGFTGDIIAHAGSFTGLTCDDLVVVQPKADNGSGTATIEANNYCSKTNKSGVFTPITPIARPTAITGDSTNYNTTGWANVQQAVALPPSAATYNQPALVTLENDNNVQTVWLFTDNSNAARFTNATLLATGSAWSGVTLISPGLINGAPTLWVRNNSTGAITEYDNITGTLTSKTLAGSGYTSATYPMITSDGPLGTVTSGATNGPALWAVTPSGALDLITTTLDGTGNVNAFQAPVTMTSTGWGSNITSLN